MTGGAEEGAPVFFIHGNVSSSRFFEETLAALPSEVDYRGFAPDLRGFGDSETKPLDATRGLGDFSDDLHALVDALGLGSWKIHLVGWSVGGTIVLRYAVDYPDRVASLTLVNPMSTTASGGPETSPACRAGQITPVSGEGRSSPIS